MQGGVLGRIPRVPLYSALASLSVAVIAVVVLGLAGEPRAGIALGSGLAVGGLNAMLITRSLVAGIPFAGMSLFRLVLMSAAALAVGVALGTDVAWLALVGLGVSQLVLAGIGVVEVVRR